MIHGGRDGSQFFSDLWVLYNASGSSGTPAWSQLTTVGTAPQRYLTASGYNRAKNTFILFGGSDSSGQIKMDLWLLSNANGLGGTATWSTLPIGGTPPSARGSVASAYDETSDTLILFGGGGCSSTACTLNNETWLLKNATTSPAWQELTPTGTPPSARANLSAVYDPSSNRLIIFGGNTSTANPPDPSARVNDTWILSSVIGSGTPSWSQLSTTIAPPARAGHSAVFDSANNRMIVFAGAGTDNTVRKDVWILTNAGAASPSWAEYLTGTPQPSARASHAAIYTGTGKNRMVIFGGDTGGGTFANDVWVLRNANGTPSTTVSAITIKGGAARVCNGYTIHLTPVATDAAGNEVSGVLFTWVSSDTTVATVSSNGLVTAVGTGTATITALGGGVSGRYTLTVSQPAPTTGGGGSETWKGTFQVTEVFNGIWTCTYTTKGNITLSLTRNGTSVSGTNVISSLQDTDVSSDPDLSCPPQAHCSSSNGDITATVDANGNLAFSFFVLDCGDYPAFTGTVSGTTMTGTVTETTANPGTGTGTTTRTLSFTVTKQ
jgi:hypothetical protein